MSSTFREPLIKKVGGSLTNLAPLERLEMLRRNAAVISQNKPSLPTDDGTLVRKTVGTANRS